MASADQEVSSQDRLVNRALTMVVVAETLIVVLLLFLILFVDKGQAEKLSKIVGFRFKIVVEE